jgi:uncharacterized delta-60 repeat protein
VGDGGLARTPVGKAARALVRDADGRLLVAGCTCPDVQYAVGGEETRSRLVVARFLGDGQPQPPGTVDRRYGDAGLATAKPGQAYDAAHAAAVDGQGRLLLAGLSSRAMALVRLLPDGRPDPAFRPGGVVTPIGARSEAHDVLVQPDGRVVVGGRVESRETWSFLLTRHLEDGGLDPSFGEGGVVVTDAAGFDEVRALAQLPDGRLVAVGSAVVDPAELRNTGLLVVRYLPDGRLDPTWGGDGSVVTDVRSGLEHARAVVVLADGRVVVGGTSNDPTGAQESDTVLVRHLPDGRLDPAFGTGGIVRTDLGPGYDALGGLAVLPGGALAAAADAGGRLVLARFAATGGLQGSTTTDLGAPSLAAGIAVRPGRVLVGARSGADTWAVVAHTTDGARDPAYGKDGVARARAGKGVGDLALQRDGAAVLVGCDCPFEQDERGGFESVSRFVAVRFAA